MDKKIALKVLKNMWWVPLAVVAGIAIAYFGKCVLTAVIIIMSICFLALIFCLYYEKENGKL